MKKAILEWTTFAEKKNLEEKPVAKNDFPRWSVDHQKTSNETGP